VAPRRLTVLVTAGLALPILLGACSASSTADRSTTTTRPAGVAVAHSACAIVSPAQIKAVLHRDVGSPRVQNSASTTVCSYPATDPSAPQDSVILGYRGGVTSAQVAAEQAAAKLLATVTDVTGSGGSAYYYTVGTGDHAATTLVSLVGETQVTVTSTAPASDAEALATQVFTTFAADATTTTTAPT
jgi:hypothetical protein